MVVIAEQNVNVINPDNIKAKIKLKECGKKQTRRRGRGRGKGLMFSSSSKIKSTG